MKKEIKIGIAGIASLVILFFGINYLKGINMFKPESYYYVKFKDINGLTVSSPVFANGYKIGIVRDLYFDYHKSGFVTVGIEVDKGISIPKESHAELVSEMLGTVKMNMIFEQRSGNFCQPGDTITGISNNGIMGVAQNELLPKLLVMVPKIDSVLTSLHSLLSDPQLRQTIHNSERLTASLESTSRQLDRLMQRDVPAITKNISQLTGNLVAISENLKSVDFAATFDKVDSTLNNVKLMTDKLNRKDNSLGLLLNDDALYQNLNATSVNAASLLEDLKSHPKRYVHFSIFGRKN